MIECLSVSGMLRRKRRWENCRERQADRATTTHALLGHDISTTDWTFRTDTGHAGDTVEAPQAHHQSDEFVDAQRKGGGDPGNTLTLSSLHLTVS